MTSTRTATCNCGAIRIETRGQPVRVGLCHCTTCRKESGAAFTTNAIWRADDVTIRGDTASWKDATDARHFCPSCGSAMFGISRRHRRDRDQARGARRGADGSGADL